MSKLFFKYATMNAGKSTALLQCAHNYKERNINPILFTSSIDNRYGIGKITSRIGINADAHVFSDKTNFKTLLPSLGLALDFGVVLIDESQFLTRKQVIDLAEFASNGNIPVLCYGIKTDFLGNLFEGSNALFCYAQDIQMLKTICRCGKAAHHNMRISQDGEPMKRGSSIAIGGNDSYEAVCTKCFFEKMGRDSLK